MGPRALGAKFSITFSNSCPQRPSHILQRQLIECTAPRHCYFLNHLRLDDFAWISIRYTIDMYLHFCKSIMPLFFFVPHALERIGDYIHLRRYNTAQSYSLSLNEAGRRIFDDASITEVFIIHVNCFLPMPLTSLKR